MSNGREMAGTWMQMVRRWVVSGAVIALLAGVLAVDAQAAPDGARDRVDVCHHGDAGWELVSVGAPALRAHLAHGDGLPFGTVPDSDGALEFDHMCGEVPFVVTVVGGESERDAVAITAALDAFSGSSGIPIEFITVDPGFATAAAIESGDGTVTDPVTGDPVPIDILLTPWPRAIGELVAAGVAVPASVVTTSAVGTAWPSDWFDLGSVDGTLYGVPARSDLKSLVWYRASAFTAGGYAVPTSWDDLVDLTQEMIDDGDTPWCVGIESGPATGWVFTDWVEDRLLDTQGPAFYDDWIANDVSFTDPAVRAAWHDVLDLWTTPGAVHDAEGLGGPVGPGIASRSFYEAALAFGAGQCLLHKQGSFLPELLPDPSDLAVLPFPGDSGSVMGAGTFAVAFRSDPDVGLVHGHLGTADYVDARRTVQPSGFLSAVSGQDPGLLGPIDAQLTDMLVEADTFRYDASDVMPDAVGVSLPVVVGPSFTIPEFPGFEFQEVELGDGFWGQGTRAVIGDGNVVDDLFLGFEPPNVVSLGLGVAGTTVADATQTIADRFCAVVPDGDAC